MPGSRPLRVVLAAVTVVGVMAALVLVLRPDPVRAAPDDPGPETTGTTTGVEVGGVGTATGTPDVLRVTVGVEVTADGVDGGAVRRRRRGPEGHPGVAGRGRGTARRPDGERVRVPALQQRGRSHHRLRRPARPHRHLPRRGRSAGAVIASVADAGGDAARIEGIAYGVGTTRRCARRPGPRRSPTRSAVPSSTRNWSVASSATCCGCRRTCPPPRRCRTRRRTRRRPPADRSLRPRLHRRDGHRGGALVAALTGRGGQHRPMARSPGARCPRLGRDGGRRGARPGRAPRHLLDDLAPGRPRGHDAAPMTGVWWLGRRRRYLRRLSGPLAMVLVVFVWLTMILLGWALIYAAPAHRIPLQQRARPGLARPALRRAVPVAVTLGTLGVGDIVRPRRPGCGSPCPWSRCSASASSRRRCRGCWRSTRRSPAVGRWRCAWHT